MKAKIYDKIIYRGRNQSIEAEKGCMPCIQNATVQTAFKPRQICSKSWFFIISLLCLTIK